MRFILLAFLSIIIFSCGNNAQSIAKIGATNPKTLDSLHANIRTMKGHWVHQSFTSRVASYRSVLETINKSSRPYCFAYKFSESKPDSVECFDGLKSWMRPVAYLVDTVTVKEVQPGVDIKIVYNSFDKTTNVFDYTVKPMVIDVFQHTTDVVESGYEVFKTLLNRKLFKGGASMVGTKRDVIFSPNGLTAGFDDWTHFEVCVRDCFVLGTEMDVITFSNPQKGTSERFGYVIKEEGMLMEIFRLTPGATPNDIYKVKELAYKVTWKRQ